jgi:hypothetical protein
MAEINWDLELSKLTEKMGLKTTDINRLLYVAGLALVKCPQDYYERFLIVFQEIERRQEMLRRYQAAKI